MSRVVRSVVVGAVVGLLCVGCSDDEPRPKMAPPPSATPSVSDAPPVDPTPTQAPEVLGPEETVRAWIDGQNVALKTGDTSDVDLLSARSCDSCEQLIGPIREIYDAGGRFETKGWVMEAANGRDSTTVEEVDAAVTITGGRTFPNATDEPVVYEEDKRILRFIVVQEAGSTVVSFVGFLS